MDEVPGKVKASGARLVMLAGIIKIIVLFAGLIASVGLAMWSENL